jgi:hypothetical protein
MPTYQLAIAFDNPGLDTLQGAGQLVTLIKSVSISGNGNSSGQVIWVAFKPMNTNTVTWTEEYSVYASTSKIVNGARITTNSSVNAVGGNTYTFLAAGHFGPSNSNLAETDYGVVNKSQYTTGDVKMITSGLYQAATVNGKQTSSPLNATPVPSGDTAQFTPIEKVQVFVSSYQNNGLVISEVTSQTLTVDLTSQPSQSIYYDSTTNQFVPGAPQGGTG